MQRFNYHSHTYRCGHADFDMTDEEYVQEYIKMGFKKVAFTDHCPEKNKIDKRNDMRMEYTERKEYLSSVKSLKEKYADKIQIETGYEVEYLPGEEENLKELKGETDKLILGQHFVYDDNKNLVIIRKTDIPNEELLRYAEYIKKAMELGIPDIIAHPDLFMLAKEEFGETEAKTAKIICEAAEKYNIPLEINLNNIFAHTYYEHRKLNDYPIEIQRTKLGRVGYPCKDFWKIASKYNIKVLYGADIHRRGQILLFDKLVSFANEIIGEEIISKLKFIEE